LEKKLKESEAARAGLAKQIETLGSELQAANNRPVPAPSAPAPAAAADTVPAGVAGPRAPLNEEVARIEKVLTDVLREIEDPATSLSTAMRKNVEKTALESYLKGIRFAMDENAPR
jgi:hypothetical protein